MWWTPSYGKITIWDGYRVSVVLALWSEVNDHNHLATHDPHHTLPTFKKKKKKILTVRLFDKKQKFIHGYFHISNGILLQTFFLQLDKDFLFLYCIMYVFKNVHVSALRSSNFSVGVLYLYSKYHHPIRTLYLLDTVCWLAVIWTTVQKPNSKVLWQ